jgi:hypothetical protein
MLNREDKILLAILFMTVICVYFIIALKGW